MLFTTSSNRSDFDMGKIGARLDMQGVKLESVAQVDVVFLFEDNHKQNRPLYVP